MLRISAWLVIECRSAMETALFTLVSAFLAMLGAGGGWYLGSQAGRRAALDSHAGVLARFDSLQAAMGGVATQVAEDMQRAASMRNRATSAESNAQKTRARQAEVPAMSEPDYVAHLARGGNVIPEVEKALGLV